MEEEVGVRAPKQAVSSVAPVEKSGTYLCLLGKGVVGLGREGFSWANVPTHIGFKSFLSVSPVLFAKYIKILFWDHNSSWLDYCFLGIIKVLFCGHKCLRITCGVLYVQSASLEMPNELAPSFGHIFSHLSRSGESILRNYL